MKKIIVLALFSFIFLSQARGEYVFKRNGEVISGKVLRETRKGVSIRDDSRRVIHVPREEILRIQYANIYMGRVIIRTTDGGMIDAFIVDEDSNAITYRTDLNRPEETKISRKKVLFITRMNPVELTGKADTDRIYIQWKAPYVPPDHYRVYLRKAGEESRFVGKTGSLKYTIRKLADGTRYHVKVTAVDSKDQESVPSDEIVLTTLKETGMDIKKDRPKKGVDHDYTLSASYHFLMPLGDLSDLFKYGHGVSLAFDRENLFLEGLAAGIDAGFYRMFPAGENTKSGMMIPACLKIAYRLELFDGFFIVPELAGGATWNILKYDQDGHPVGGAIQYKTKSQIEPLARGGLFLRLLLFKDFYLSAGAEYLMIFEKSRSLGMLSFSGGLSYGF